MVKIEENIKGKTERQKYEILRWTKMRDTHRGQEDCAERNEGIEEKKRKKELFIKRMKNT